ncbi:MAG TPA: NAD(P)H-dependent dehydrogenase/reductase [Desulfobulbaceae bacterium]|uniref:nitroreductase family protein n=1 Tax=Desulfuromonas sp. CSMB_57 TaxID=2807629 RepID=UPI000E9770C2|nr:nitroreductase family protein [Desulfuromonas sp. CSMB_57]HBI14254.1 NAD(P)H-dependent dehydrogenase/reductase [Desulfobulbaceae bacterium]
MLLSLLRKRRSIRRFQPRPVEREKMDQLLEALLRSPSSRGLNPWEFVVVTEPALLAKLSRCKKHGADFIKGAAFAIVVCAKPEICDVWIEDCSIAAIIAQLTAEDLGLSSCWVQVRLRSMANGRSSEEYVAELLQLPAGMSVASVIAFGYGNEKAVPHAEESLPKEKIHFNAFGSH